jgi:hypothetical protein
MHLHALLHSPDFCAGGFILWLPVPVCSAHLVEEKNNLACRIIKIKGCPYQEYLSVTEQTACLLSYEQMNPLMITDKAVSSVLFIFGSGLTILKKTPR